MKCPFCELDQPYIQAGSACPHCGKLIPVPAAPAEPPEAPEPELEAANDTAIPDAATGPGPETETDQDVEGLMPPDEPEPDADPDESG